MPVEYNQEKECYVIRFEIHVDGNRIRKTKRMPRGMDLATATAIEKRMIGQLDDAHFDLRSTLKAIPENPVGPGYVYAAMGGDGTVKIGMTRRTVWERIRSFNTSAAIPWREIDSVLVKNPEATEGAMHAYLVDQRIHLNRELFSVTEGKVREMLEIVREEVEHISGADYFMRCA
jgi:hypothetical protein